MKKMTKGAIVTGLGVALLLGGGGTLATWNAEQTANAGTIQSGNLELKVKNETPWTSNFTDGPITTGHKIVPGEVLTYTQQVEIKKEGQGLKAALKATGMHQIVDGYSGMNAFGSTLTPAVTVTNPKGQSSPVPLGDYKAASYTLDEDAKAGTYTVTATVAFRADQKQAMNASLNLNSIKFNLEQTTK